MDLTEFEAKTKNKFVLVEFFNYQSPRILFPKVGAEILSINVEESPDLVKRFQLCAVPYLSFLINGIEVERALGLIDKSWIEAKIQEFTERYPKDLTDQEICAFKALQANFTGQVSKNARPEDFNDKDHLVGHLLCNLMLYCKRYHLDFEAELAYAKNQYFFEENLIND